MPSVMLLYAGYRPLLLPAGHKLYCQLQYCAIFFISDYINDAYKVEIKAKVHSKQAYNAYKARKGSV